MRNLFLILLRSCLFLLAAMMLVLLVLSAWLERFLRRVTPLVLAALPPEYRHVLAVMVAPPSQDGGLE